MTQSVSTQGQLWTRQLIPYSSADAIATINLAAEIQMTTKYKPITPIIPCGNVYEAKVGDEVTHYRSVPNGYWNSLSTGPDGKPGVCKITKIDDYSIRATVPHRVVEFDLFNCDKNQRKFYEFGIQRDDNELGPIGI